MRTLICVHEPALAESTVTFGSLVTSALDSKVILLSFQPSTAKQQAEALLLSQSAALLPVPPAAQLLRRGEFPEAILAELKTHLYDLLIIGIRERPSLTDLLLGSMRQLVTQTDTSVLFVRHPSPQFKRLLICTGGAEQSENPVRTGAQLANATGAQIKLLHVTGTIPSMYAGLNQMNGSLPAFLHSNTPIANRLKAQAALFRSLNIEATLELRHGVPAEEILRAMELEDFDLVVIGAPVRQGLHKYLFDDVASVVIDHSPRPVLVVRENLGLADEDPTANTL